MNNEYYGFASTGFNIPMHESLLTASVEKARVWQVRNLWQP